MGRAVVVVVVVLAMVVLFHMLLAHPAQEMARAIRLKLVVLIHHAKKGLPA